MAPGIASFSMGRSLWLPFGLAGLIWVAAICLVGSLPLSEDAQLSARASYVSSNSDEQDETSRRTVHDGEDADSPRRRLLGVTQDTIPCSQHALRASLALIFTPRLGTALFVFFLKKIGFGSEFFLFQYASEKFGLQLENTAWLRMTQAGASSFTNLVANPLFTARLIMLGNAAPTTALYIIRYSLTILMLGFLLCWWAQKLWILMTGMLPEPYNDQSSTVLDYAH